ncbi:MAG: mechanosensitive ion channel family protein [Thermoanaerobaculia bacterium]
MRWRSVVLLVAAILGGYWIAISTLPPSPRSVREVAADLATRGIDHLPGVIAGLLILLGFAALAGLVVRLLRRIFRDAGADPALAHVTLPLARAGVLALGLVMALEQVGLNVGSLVAGLGIAGLAVGLAAQELLSNLVAGVVLLWDRPFSLDDNVTIAGIDGRVVEIGLRATRLRTLENREVTLPNREVTQRQIVNHSRYPTIRIGVPLAIGYRADLDAARAALLDVARAAAGVAAEPPPQVVVTALGESGVAIELRVWVERSAPEQTTGFALLEAAKRALDAAGIEIPFPQRVVRLAEPLAAAPSGSLPAPEAAAKLPAVSSTGTE